MESLKKLISIPEWMVQPETVQIMQVLNSGYGEARFVGGCVRDTLANVKTYDIDIAVNYEPDVTIALLRDNNIKFIPTGLEFGTVTAVINGRPFEITSLREDIETFGRKASVKFTTDWKKDAARRDFTINAIYANLDGELFDYFGGIEDLRKGVVKFIGSPDERVKEDYLRILRYFRFFGKFSQQEPNYEAMEACTDNAEGLKEISIERITIEFLKILDIRRVSRVLHLMHESNVLELVLPECGSLEVIERLQELEEEYSNNASSMRRLSALIKDNVYTVKNLRLSKAQIRELDFLREISKKHLKSLDENEIKALVYKKGNDAARSILLLVAARSKEYTNLQDLYAVATSFKPPVFPINGDDVIAEGVEEGSKVGFILDLVEDWWLGEGFKPKRSECLSRIKKILVDGKR